MIRRFLLPLTANLLLVNLVLAQVERPGSASGTFLKIGVHARGSAMGSAYITLPSGAEATYYNPAGLARIQRTAISFNHTALYADIGHDFVAVSHSFGRRIGTFAFSLTALYTDAMKVRTPLQPDGTGATFRVFDYRAGLSYSRYLTDRISFGGTFNYIESTLAGDFVSRAVSADIAVLYVTGFRGFSFGMMISNFGSELTYVNEGYPLPGEFTFGLSLDAVQTSRTRLTLSTTAAKPNDGRPLAHLGAEWNYADLLQFRTGYQPNHDTGKWSFGGGLAITIVRTRLNLNYALSNYGELGLVQRVGMDVFR